MIFQLRQQFSAQNFIDDATSEIASGHQNPSYGTSRCPQKPSSLSRTPEKIWKISKPKWLNRKTFIRNKTFPNTRLHSRTHVRNSRVLLLHAIPERGGSQGRRNILSFSNLYRDLWKSWIIFHVVCWLIFPQYYWFFNPRAQKRMRSKESPSYLFIREVQVLRLQSADSEPRFFVWTRFQSFYSERWFFVCRILFERFKNI